LTGIGFRYGKSSTYKCELTFTNSKTGSSEAKVANTWAGNVIDATQGRIDAAAEEHRTAYTMEVFLPLRHEDIRDISEGKFGAHPAEGNGPYYLWIWRITLISGDTQGEGNTYLLDRRLSLRLLFQPN